MPADLATLVSRAFVAPPADDVSDATRMRILDAALHEAASVGIGRVRMDDVVQRSGLGRNTVYRRFSKRDELIDALVVRECQRFFAAVATGLAGDEAAEGRMAMGFVAAMSFVRRHPLLRRVAESDPGAAMATASANERLVLNLGRGFIAGQLRHELPDADQRAIDRTADLVARLFLTYVALPPDDPDPRDESELHAYACDVLAPVIAAGVGGPGALA
ncbi:MAG: TetR/AcrR family transcriptional regulator [Solirubrobacteraceae bacterium]|nr:TetR/AcrR family transcriptional regulator [Solirubrobacteraceae bacterium]